MKKTAPGFNAELHALELLFKYRTVEAWDVAGALPQDLHCDFKLSLSILLYSSPFFFFK